MSDYAVNCNPLILFWPILPGYRVCTSLKINKFRSVQNLKHENVDFITECNEHCFHNTFFLVPLLTKLTQTQHDFKHLIIPQKIFTQSA